MDYMLDDEWFNKPKIHTIDALCATGSRINRWLTELPKEKAERLQITGADLDEEALEYAQQNCPGVEFRNEDSRQVLLSSGWQWVDIDPFDLVPFLDSAMQSSARRAVMEITATDTALNRFFGKGRSTSIWGQNSHGSNGARFCTQVADGDCCSNGGNTRSLYHSPAVFLGLSPHPSLRQGTSLDSSGECIG